MNKGFQGSDFFDRMIAVIQLRSKALLTHQLRALLSTGENKMCIKNIEKFFCIGKIYFNIVQGNSISWYLLTHPNNKAPDSSGAFFVPLLFHERYVLPANSICSQQLKCMKAAVQACSPRFNSHL
jgi:hypothetical protein